LKLIKYLLLTVSLLGLLATAYAADTAKTCSDLLVDENHKETLLLCTTPINEGDANAQYNLGVKCQNGNSLTQDDKQSVDWYITAAKQGHVDAQYSLLR
jgi:TPR repeat protein